MVGHGGSSAGSYLADPTSPIPSHCASIVATSTLRVNIHLGIMAREWAYKPFFAMLLSIMTIQMTLVHILKIFKQYINFHTLLLNLEVALID